MARNFHRWEADPFFCAAEEVQYSAERRELVTALGTVKWQLEDFERVVFSGIVDDCDQGVDDAVTRHRQFVDALQNQIDTVDRALSSLEHCRDAKPHQALQLGKKEKDELEMFLWGTQSCKEENVCCEAFKVGKPVKVVVCPRVPLDHTDGPVSLAMLAANSDVDFRIPSSDACPWRHDMSSSDKLLPDLNDTEITSVSERRMDEISKPVFDPTCEYLNNDRGKPCTERVDGHYGSVTVGTGSNSWKIGSMIDVKRDRRRLISVEVPSDRLNFWAIFTKGHYARKFSSSFKKWKDGEANGRDNVMLALMHDSHDIEQGIGSSCLGTRKMLFNGNGSVDHANATFKHQTRLQDVLQIWQSPHFGLPFGRLVQITSALLIVSGVVGFCHFM